MYINTHTHQLYTLHKNSYSSHMNALMLNTAMQAETKHFTWPQRSRSKYACILYIDICLHLITISIILHRDSCAQLVILSVFAHSTTQQYTRTTLHNHTKILATKPILQQTEKHSNYAIRSESHKCQIEYLVYYTIRYIYICRKHVFA